MSKKLITLTPMGSYFFGGERSFPVGKDKNELSSYIVESNKFPQQTSLLGMLRFWLLRNSDAFNSVENQIKKDKRAEVIDLIGTKSFSVDGKPFDEGKSQFGKIKNIDFCFLQKDDHWILPIPLDYKLNIDFSKFTNAAYNKEARKIPYITYQEKDELGKEKRYTDKEGLIRGYIDNNGNFLEEEEIFKKDQRIGINRNVETGKTDDNALYKQVFYRLKDGFYFAFIAEFTDDDLPPSGQIVELGGDSSKFILEYKDVGQEVFYDEKLLDMHSSYSKIILLSDTKIESGVIKQNTVFSISEHIPFQFLSFETNENTKYSRTSQNNKQGRYSLFKRGSVFYFDDNKKLEAFESALNNKYLTFQQIGYNKYQSKKINNDGNK